MRKLGDITLDMEKLLCELTDDHELQMGEILALIKSWIEIHRRESIEIYIDNTNPIYYYGHRDEILIEE